MSCSACHNLVHQLLDGETQSPSPALRDHLIHCASCRSLLAAARLLQRGLDETRQGFPSSSFADRVVAGIQCERSRRIPGTRVRSRLVLAVAASLLFLLSLTLAQHWGHSTRSDAPRALASKPDKAPHGGPFRPEPKESIPEEALVQDKLWKEAGTALTSLTTRAADETVGQGRLLLPVMAAPLEELGLAQPQLTSPMPPLPNAGPAVVASFEPVTTSARRAVDLFLRDFSPSGPGQNPGL